MEDLEKQLYEEQIKSLRINRVYSFIKSIVAIIGGIVIFLMITNPDYLLRKEATQEEIARERAELVLQYILDDTLDSQTFKKLKFIKDVYGPFEEKSITWVDDLSKELFVQTKDKQIEALNDKLNNLKRSRDALEKDPEKNSLTKLKIRAFGIQIRETEKLLNRHKKERELASK